MLREAGELLVEIGRVGLSASWSESCFSWTDVSTCGIGLLTCEEESSTTVCILFCDDALFLGNEDALEIVVGWLELCGAMFSASWDSRMISFSSVASKHLELSVELSETQLFVQ